MSSRIKSALPELVENGIITDKIAQNIITYYSKSTQENSNKLFVIFGILGATLVGLGIILIMAHNWDQLSRFTKLFLAFLPMLIGQAGLGYSIVKDKSAVWKETATVFLFFSVGACIALISQIYNTPENIELFLLAWICLCTPLLYVTKSKAIIFLHVSFCTYYAIVTGYGYNVEASPLLYFVLLAIGIPRYVALIKQKTRSAATTILHWLFPLSLTISLPVCMKESPSCFLFMCLFGLLINIGQLPYFKNKSVAQNGYKVVGTAGTLIVLLILSFQIVLGYILPYNFTITEAISGIILFMLTGLVFLLNNTPEKFKNVELPQVTLLIFILILLIGGYHIGITAALFNILLFTIGILYIKKGTRTMHFGYLNLGMIVIAMVIICRFYDTDISFALRGLIFVSIGIGFFIANYIMYKKQQLTK